VPVNVKHLALAIHEFAGSQEPEMPLSVVEEVERHQTHLQWILAEDVARLHIHDPVAQRVAAHRGTFEMLGVAGVTARRVRLSGLAASSALSRDTRLARIEDGEWRPLERLQQGIGSHLRLSQHNRQKAAFIVG